MGNAKKNRRTVGSWAVMIMMMLAAVSFVGMAGCAPRQTEPAPSGQGGDNSVVTVAWTPDMECSSCHVKEAESSSDTACLASKHGEATCESCHGSADLLAAVHTDASASSEMPTKLSKSNEVSEEACLACHGSWDELAEKSVEVTVLTDADGTVVNPHSMNRTGDHQVITCDSCHVEHAPEKDQKELCLSCHHEDVFECGTCHE